MLCTLGEIDAAYLDKVCQELWPESTTLDFKRIIPGASEQQKSEFLKDACAMANSDGGDLVYGIDEDTAGSASALSPIVAASMDAEVRRLQQLLDSNIEPRIPSVRFRSVAVAGGHVMVVRVASSFQGPHCVRQGSSRRFVLRNGALTTDMTFEQLRWAFDRTATLADKAQNFIRQRIEAINAGRTPLMVAEGARAIVHIVPLAAIDGRQAINLETVTSNYSDFVHQGWLGCDRSFNFEGAVFHPSVIAGRFKGYTQVFRGGALEAVTSVGQHYDQFGHVVWSASLSKFAHRWIGHGCRLLTTWGLGGPAFVSIALVHVGANRLAITSQVMTTPTPRSEFLPLPVWVEDTAGVETDAVARSLLDVVSQGFGEPRCRDFNEAGEFRPRN